MDILKKTHQITSRWTKAQKTIFLGVGLSGLMLVVAMFSKEGFMTVYELEAELKGLGRSNVQLQNENDTLRAEIAALKTDPFEVERLAREKLNMVRPGEVVYQIVPQVPQPRS